jgi:hypothetical protein
MVTRAGFLNKVFWLFEKWTKINVHFWISGKTFPKKKRMIGLHE